MCEAFMSNFFICGCGKACVSIVVAALCEHRGVIDDRSPSMLSAFHFNAS